MESRARRSALLAVRSLTAAAMIKGALGGLAFLALSGHPEMWTGGVPLSVHLLVIVFMVTGSLLIRTRYLPFLYSSAFLACIAATYADRPLVQAGLDLTRFRVEAFAPFVLWLLVLQAPTPLRSKLWRRLALACTAFCAIAGAWSFASNVFVILPRAWGSTYLQVWDLTIPLALLAALIFTVRSLLARQELGLAYAASLLPMLLVLALWATVPSFGDLAERHLPLLTGFVTAALVSLPVWLIKLSRQEDSSPLGERAEWR